MCSDLAPGRIGKILPRNTLNGELLQDIGSAGGAQIVQYVDKSNNLRRRKYWLLSMGSSMCTD